jgi:cytochrome c6
MLSTIGLVVFALSTGHKVGLAAVGGAFIVFALVSSFVLPLRNPNFPGRGLRWYVALTVLFFVAMISAVLVFGKEKAESKAETAAAPTSTASSSTAPATKGDPAAGKAVFASAGCNSCHTLKAAGATGTVGPNLDNLKPDEARVVRQVTNGGAIMPAFKGKLTPKQIQDVAAFVFASTH